MSRPLPPFNIHAFRQHMEEQKLEKFYAQARAHHDAMQQGAMRHEARISSYKEGDFGRAVDFVTRSLGSPGSQREWKKIIRAGEDAGFNGLSRSEAYQAFQKQAHEHLRDLGPDSKRLVDHLTDALKPENMTHFLGLRVSSTDPNPRETLLNVLAGHINPKDEAALKDAEHAQQYRRHLLNEAAGQAPKRNNSP